MKKIRICWKSKEKGNLIVLYSIFLLHAEFIVIGLYLEVGSKDAQILKHDNDLNFDWEQFVMHNEDEENLESTIVAKATEELIKNPKLDIKKRLKTNLKGYNQKQYVRIVDENTEEYKDYYFKEEKNMTKDINIPLFTKEIPKE